MLLSLIILDFYLVFPFFVLEGVPNHGDVGFPTTLSRYGIQFITLFNDYGSVTNVENIDRAIFMLPLVTFGQIIGLGMGQFVGMLYFILLFSSQVSIILFTRLIISKIHPLGSNNNILLGGFTAAIIYSFSPWVLEQTQAYYYWLAYALTPLALYLFITIIERRVFDFPRVFALSLVLAFIFTTPQYLLYTIGIMIVVGLFFGIRNELVYRKYLLFNVLFLLALTLALNFYWIYPSIIIGLEAPSGISPGYTLKKDDVILFSRNATYFNVFKGDDQWISWSHFNRGGGWILAALTVPLLSFYSIRYFRKREILFLWILYAIFFLLSLGVNSRIYDFVLELPLSWLWRVPGKLSYFLWIVYSVSASILILDATQRLSRKDDKILFTAIVSGILLSSFIIANVSKISAYFGFYYLPSTIPKEYHELNDWLSKQDGNFKVLYLTPYFQGLGKNNLAFESSFTWNPDKIIGNMIEYSSAKPSIGYIHFTYRDWERLLYPKIYGAYGTDFTIRKNIGEILQPYNVKYLIYHADIVGTEADVKEDLLELSNSDLKPIRQFGNFIYLYENPFVGDEIVKEDQQRIQPLDYTKVRSTFYEISNKTLNDAPFNVTFAKVYDPLWIAKADGNTIQPVRNANGLIDFVIDKPVQDKLVIQYLPQQYYDYALCFSFYIYAIGLTLAVLSLFKGDLMTRVFILVTRKVTIAGNILGLRVIQIVNNFIKIHRTYSKGSKMKKDKS